MNDIRKTWKNSHVSYPSGKPMIPHLLRCQGFGVVYYSLALGHLGSVVSSTFATLGVILLLQLLICPILSAKVGAQTSEGLPEQQKHRESNNGSQTIAPRHKKFKTELGGHLKVHGSASWPDDESFYHNVGTGAYYDAGAEARLKGQIFIGDSVYLDAHYEAIVYGGDTRKKTSKLKRLFPGIFNDNTTLTSPVDDKRRFMDLTSTLEENNDSTVYHRLDRLSLTFTQEQYVARIGRQAVTWGNGLLFNPMDLFNPFSPTEIERDYKLGDDIVYVQYSQDMFSDLQFLCIPRRNSSNGNLEADKSSLAGKVHFSVNTTELDIMAARHYEDEVIGIGSSGYLGNAAWRIDTTWTFLKGDNDYLSLIANVDYSWVLWGKNLYGFVEFFLNGLGDDDYTQSFANAAVSQRLARGELFTLGRSYLSGHIRAELHPLFNLFLTVINNMEDPSGILQPRATWDIIQDIQMTFGGNLFYGKKGSEYGGYKLPGTNLINKPSDSLFLWLTYFF
ncbi:MAG: hypothetical protein BBJ60_08335 [Desulfobacterales bacterium S7086C20]|nr:MAG: hypothetical protein BBJ60_08335 [Desulfobacterales bacterium S7086C20]